MAATSLAAIARVIRALRSDASIVLDDQKWLDLLEQVERFRANELTQPQLVKQLAGTVGTAKLKAGMQTALSTPRSAQEEMVDGLRADAAVGGVFRPRHWAQVEDAAWRFQQGQLDQKKYIQTLQQLLKEGGADAGALKLDSVTHTAPARKHEPRTPSVSPSPRSSRAFSSLQGWRKRPSSMHTHLQSSSGIKKTGFTTL